MIRTYHQSRLLLCFCLLLFCVLLLFAGGAQASPKSMHISFGPAFTKLRQDFFTLFIDYENAGVYHYKTAGSCQFFPFVGQGKDSEVLEARTKIFSELKILEPVAEGPTKGHKRRSIIFAPKTMFTKSAVDARLSRYGVMLSPGRAEYLVEPNHKQAQNLFEAAKRNRRYYQKHPILKQIDPIGLIEDLQGVPVKLTKAGKEQEFTYTPIKAKDISTILPEVCRNDLNH